MFNKIKIEENEYQLAPYLVKPTLRKPRVAILLATYNGAEYLCQQLESISRQTHDNWLIAVSDDGSSDTTLELLSHYRERLGESRLLVFTGPGRGFASNFLSLIYEKSIVADYFAFSDQDDCWHPDRLEKALRWLQEIDRTQPALYCGRTHLINNSGESMGYSPVFDRTPAFKNALVQSIAGGNTMVFNSAARQLLAQAGPLSVVSHDWWSYMLISGAGGRVNYDSQPSIDYRQHGGNLVGANSRMIDRIHRLKRMFAGHFKLWNDSNINALNNCQHLLTQEHRNTLNEFSTARQASLFARCKGVLKSGVYRQTTPGNLGLVAATLLGKI